MIEGKKKAQDPARGLRYCHLAMSPSCSIRPPMANDRWSGFSSQDLGHRRTDRKHYLSLEKLIESWPQVIKILSLVTAVAVILFPDPLRAQPVEVVVVGREACRSLTAHTPAADVEYKPGVDVKGRPVTPADLPAEPAPNTEQVRVALKRNIVIGTGGLGASEIVVGEVAVDLASGKAMLNGKPVDQAFQSDIVAACRRR